MNRKQLEVYIDKYSQVAQSIMSSMNSIQKEIFKDSIITPDQFNLLNEINVRGTCTSSLLAKELNVKKSTITAIVNRLVDKGLLNRIHKENDRRFIILKLTEKGRGVLEGERKNIFDKLAPLGYKLPVEEFERVWANMLVIDEQLKNITKGMKINDKGIE
ncbi:MarR family transcriptional regulator [Bacillus subtilis]|nr:MarR family transcriptional regulator [Bacillus subtilis]